MKDKSVFVAIGSAFVAVGILLIGVAIVGKKEKVMQLPVSRPEPRGVGGFECGEEKCFDQPTFAKCIACCSSKCVDVEGCDDFCLYHWGAKVVGETLAKAATGLTDGTITDPNDRAEAVTVIEKCQVVKDLRISRIARKLASDGVPGVRLLSQ